MTKKTEQNMGSEMAMSFAGGQVDNRQDAVTASSIAGTVAEIQGRMVIAKKFPRDQRRAFDSIINACQRPTLAGSALYTYSRGGTDISGPSIRLAEAMAQNWGNLDFGIREIDQQGGESTVEAFAWDIETNVRQVKTFRVPHKRYTKRGTYNLEDPRDIYEAVANNGARRLRACILGVIPGDVVDAAVLECEKTMKASADVSEKGVKKVTDAFFDDFGVTREQLETRIQRRMDAITPAQVVGLRKIYTSLKDGMSSVGDWFEGTLPKQSPFEKTPAPPPATATEPDAPADLKADPMAEWARVIDASPLTLQDWEHFASHRRGEEMTPENAALWLEDAPRYINACLDFLDEQKPAAGTDGELL